MTYTDIKAEQPLTLKNIEKTAIINYFITINQEEFTQTASLFTEKGQLLAPFEKPIIGKEAIASYLDAEAKGMKLLPEKGISELIEDNLEKVTVTGKVKTSLFTVNVAWHFLVNRDRQITIAQIKLIASPQELLGLKKITEQTQ